MRQHALLLYAPGPGTAQRQTNGCCCSPQAKERTALEPTKRPWRTQPTFLACLSLLVNPTHTEALPRTRCPKQIHQIHQIGKGGLFATHIEDGRMQLTELTELTEFTKLTKSEKGILFATPIEDCPMGVKELTELTKLAKSEKGDFSPPISKMAACS